MATATDGYPVVDVEHRRAADVVSGFRATVFRQPVFTRTVDRAAALVQHADRAGAAAADDDGTAAIFSERATRHGQRAVAAATAQAQPIMQIKRAAGERVITEAGYALANPNFTGRIQSPRIVDDHAGTR